MHLTATIASSRHLRSVSVTSAVIGSAASASGRWETPDIGWGRFKRPDRDGFRCVPGALEMTVVFERVARYPLTFDSLVLQIDHQVGEWTVVVAVGLHASDAKADVRVVVRELFE